HIFSSFYFILFYFLFFGPGLVIEANQVFQVGLLLACARSAARCRKPSLPYTAGIPFAVTLPASLSQPRRERASQAKWSGGERMARRKKGRGQRERVEKDTLVPIELVAY
ncbi:Uncharacterized protein APZ42_029012, partial [Daphnia magna]